MKIKIDFLFVVLAVIIILVVTGKIGWWHIILAPLYAFLGVIGFVLFVFVCIILIIALLFLVAKYLCK